MFKLLCACEQGFATQSVIFPRIVALADRFFPLVDLFLKLHVELHRGIVVEKKQKYEQSADCQQREMRAATHPETQFFGFFAHTFFFLTCKINYSGRLIKITYMLRNDKNKEVPVSDTEKARLLKTFSPNLFKSIP